MLKKLLVFCALSAAMAALMLPQTSSVIAAPDGKAIYDAKCAACHQPSGQGMPGTFPPLAGNKDVTGDAKSVIAAVAKGKSGALTVAGTAYNSSMPAWRGQLSDAEIAAVVTYVRSAWGNKASAVTEKQVSAVK